MSGHPMTSAPGKSQGEVLTGLFFAAAMVMILGAGLGLAAHGRAAITVNAGHPALKTEAGKLTYLGRLYTGVVVERYPSGQTASRTAYRSGLKDGLFQAWHANGRLAEERAYAQDLKEGRHHGWYEDGSPKFSYEFVNGEYHGEARTWYPGGRPATRFTYTRGYEEGPQKAWRENGKIYLNTIVKEGRSYGLNNARLCFKVDGNQRP